MNYIRNLVTANWFEHFHLYIIHRYRTVIILTKRRYILKLDLTITPLTVYNCVIHIVVNTYIYYRSAIRTNIITA